MSPARGENLIDGGSVVVARRGWLERRGPVLALTIGLVAAFVAAHWFDHAAARWLLADPARGVEGKDWFRLARVMGFAGTWAVVAAAFMLVDVGQAWAGGRGRLGESPVWLRGPFLLVSVLLAGVVAEGLKLVIRRERPLEDAPGSAWTGGGTSYEWVPWGTGTLDSSALGLPSSHAAVAFAAAFALSQLHPRLAWLMLPLALACGLTRTLVGQHFVSDVMLGGLVGLAVPWTLTWLHGRGK